jgi:phosphate transporter
VIHSRATHKPQLTRHHHQTLHRSRPSLAHFALSNPRFSPLPHSFGDPGRSPSGLPTTVAPTRPDSIELVEYNHPSQDATGPDLRPTATAQPSSLNTRPFAPAANSQALALAGLLLELDEAAHEKSFEGQRRPPGVHFTRLRFWTEALRRRAQASESRKVDSHTDTDTGTESGSGSGSIAKMKFSHSVQFNAVPDWSSNYIAYSNLKKL